MKCLILVRLQPWRGQYASYVERAGYPRLQALHKQVGGGEYHISAPRISRCMVREHLTTPI